MGTHNPRHGDRLSTDSEADVTPQEKREGVYLPAWTLAVLVAMFLSATGWTANTLLETRETMRLVVDRVQRLEAGDANRSALPVQLGRLEEKIDALTKEAAAVREDVRRLRSERR